MADWAHAGAARLVAALRAGEVSSRELLDLYLGRIEAADPALNAVVTLDTERAHRLAAGADEALARGEAAGPLAGLPITIKDTIETEGLRTTAGAPWLSGHIPDRDATAVARLKAAGAIVFAKTNCPLYGGDAQSENVVFGTTGNPWDTGRSPGGSSGGSAAALAAGQTALELGSDIGGSVRNPAHYCGIYGHKPSFGIIPTRGHIPPPPGALCPVDLAVVGPLGRDAEDLALALDTLAGPDEADCTAWRLDLPPPRGRALSDYRVGVWLEDPACPVASAVGDVLDNAVDALASAGANLSTRLRPDFTLAEAHRTYQRLLYGVTTGGLANRVYGTLLAKAQELEPDDDGRNARYLRDGTARHRDWLAADEERARYRARWREFFGRCDILLCPTVPTTAIRHDHTNINRRTIDVDGETRDYWDQIIWPGMASMAGLPATVAPVGRASDGLPVGIQIVGPYLEDAGTIHFARLLAAVLGGYEPPSAFA
jgi:amidase